SFKLVIFSLVGIVLICAFAGIEPLASYKDTALDYAKTQGSKIAESTKATAPIATLPEPEDTISAVEKVKPAVVMIEVEDGGGSGMIIDKSGYVLTCYHVVEGAKSATVILTDGGQYQSTVVGKNETDDIAIIEITASGIDFPVVTLGSSDELEIGEEVMAVGYPLGLEGGATFSKGIISAFRYAEGLRYVQTDAAINPGNSGGPLIDPNGNVIGIATFKVVHEAVEGMGFAIAIDSVKPFITEQMTREQALYQEEGEQRQGQSLLELEKETFRLINVERQSRGIPLVFWNEGMHEGARKHSENMQEKGYLYHDTGGQFAECCYGGPLQYAPESLTAAGIVQSWMSSTAGHREILLDPQYRIGAVGIASDKGFWATYRCY
ncbi:MAG: trypsin-like peptidase domain-containing protein, partial [Dehalococcoidia bacterium]|nr:trypsin-like peptidase domain-containing protein [Dehalococcoidia bacterium]